MSCRLVSFGRAGLAVFVIATLSCGGSGTEPVVPVLTTVTVALSSPTIQVAQTASATVTGLDQNGASIAVGAVTWSTGSASVASITAAGVVTGVTPGQTVVIASAGGKQGQQSLTVLAVPVASVTVSPSAPSVAVGGTQQLTATTLDATGATLTGRTIAWTTSDATKATVSSTGLVTAVAGGTATITATSEGKSGTSAVTVTVPVATVTVAPASPTVIVGSTQQLTAATLDANGATLTGRTITWTTSDATKATVSSTGLVTAVAVGTATITATSEGKSGTSVVTVAPVPVATVTVAPASPTVIVGSTQQLTATTLDANGATLTGRTITWTTSDATKATVSSTGLVTAVAVGTATITATSEGKSGTSAVTVTVPVATVTVAPATASIAVGATQQFTATLKDASGNTLTGRTVTWTSMNTNYATVNSSTGLATAVAAGIATITATSETKEGTATLTVSGLTCTGTPQLGCGLASDQFSQIPTGTFQMGSTAGNSDELPVHTVTISSFNMQKTEVTQGQWREVMGTNPSYFPTCGDTCPVDAVSWNDIQTFLTTLNARTPGVTYRLPTEAEWEYAARAGTTGETYGALDSIAWYYWNSGQKTHAAAGKQANAWGLYDMLGNVMEWVNDWYGPYTSTSATNPSGPATGTYRVLRGGSCDLNSGSARAAYRSSYDYPMNRGSYGFRLVRTP